MLVAITTAALGVWQLERRVWKLDLIAAVDARTRAAPVSAPAPGDWQQLTAARDAYLRVRVSGRFDYDHEVLVWATTGRGEGYWLLTPLRTATGWAVLVNRGFVPAGPARISRPQHDVTVTGLLRVTEPGGTFLQGNKPEMGRWYSRDVEAIISAEGLRETAPYFIDADASSPGDGFPLGGLTVVRFRNAHLGYALTWFALSALSLVGLRTLLRTNS